MVPLFFVFQLLWPCTFRRFNSPGVTLVVSSDQATLRHPQGFTYRCFLPDLTGFMSSRRTGPNPHHHLPGADPKEYKPRLGIQPCYSGLQVQGTATSPPSTTNN